MTMMGAGNEERVAFAIERLLQAGEGWRGLVRDMVGLWPDVLPLELGFALVSAASAIETSFAPGSPAREGAARGYRLAALLSMDVYAMQSLQMRHERAAELQAYWHLDPFFAEL